MWDWFHDAEGASSYLVRVAEHVEKGYIRAPGAGELARRARALAGKVIEFERVYSDYGDGLILGYFVIITDIIWVNALVASGEAEPVIETVDIEDWLNDFNTRNRADWPHDE